MDVKGWREVPMYVGGPRDGELEETLSEAPMVVTWSEPMDFGSCVMPVLAPRQDVYHLRKFAYMQDWRPFLVHDALDEREAAKRVQGLWLGH